MKNNSKRRKIAIYIDGSNLYFSIKKTFNLKINIEKLCKKLAGENELVKINYYIAPVNQKIHPTEYIEQQKFFDILRKIEKLTIILGRLEKRKREGDIYFVEIKRRALFNIFSFFTFLPSGKLQLTEQICNHFFLGLLVANNRRCFWEEN